MINPLIAFVEERKLARVKKTKGFDAIAKLHGEYEFLTWVESAADRAGQLNVASHPGSFSHPDAKISPLLSGGSPRQVDGYVRSGNVDVIPDAFGNAAALDVLAFLKLVLDDGRTVLDHLTEGTPGLQHLLGVDDVRYQSIRERFLRVLENSGDLPMTREEVKQVYFPLPNDQYHLLSLVAPSGLMREHRIRIAEAERGESAKEAREAHTKKVVSEHHYERFPKKTDWKLGGANPQNVSTFNAECRGSWPLLACLPPELRTDYLPRPKSDYFDDQLRWDGYWRKLFGLLDEMFRMDRNNIDIRERRKDLVERLWTWASASAMPLQSLPGGWTNDQKSKLPMHQKVWLDAAHAEQRGSDDRWRSLVANDFAVWLMRSYEKMQLEGQPPVPLGVVERVQFRDEVAQMPFDAQEWQRWDT